MGQRVASTRAAAGRRGGRVGSLAALLVAGTVAAFAAVFIDRETAGSELTTSTLVPVADAYVDGASPAQNFGKLKRLNGPVQEGRPRIHVRKSIWSASAVGGSVARVANTTWSETGVTYANRPTSWDASVAAFGAVKSNTWVEVRVTGAVTTGRLLTLAVRSTSTDAAIYKSREVGAGAPQLIVT